jgi:uncharacterized repeat protein (TIGR01451 family)
MGSGRWGLRCAGVKEPGPFGFLHRRKRYDTGVADKIASNVFVSWSGPPSRRAAEALREYLPYVVRDAVIWISSEDIAKGAVWGDEISTRLADCRIGIIVLTPANQAAPWVLFEAGALYKGLPDRRVCTLLVGFKPPLTGPLALFQATLPTKADCLKLFRDVDTALGGGTGSKVEVLFEKFWPELEKELAGAAKEAESHDSTAVLSDRKILEEILGVVQQLARRPGTSPREDYPAIVIEVTGIPDPVAVGEEVNFSIKVRNQGFKADTNLKAVFTLASGLTYVGGGGASAVSVSGSVITMGTIPILGPKQEVTWTVLARGTAPNGSVQSRLTVTTDFFKAPIHHDKSTMLYQQ